MRRKHPYRIHFQHGFHSLELYDAKGREIYDVGTAVEEATRQFPNESWEVYNGEEAKSHNWSDEQTEETKP